MNNRQKILNLHPIDQKAYQHVSLDHLIMYVVSILDQKGIDLSFENIVVAAHRLFPMKFQLLGFPEFPDGKRVHDCLFRCTFKTKQWLGGKTRQGFIVTDRSRIFIDEAQSLLGSESGQKIKINSQTRRKEFVLAEVEKSSAFVKYRSNSKDSISEADFCFLLQGTLDSPKKILKSNLQTLKDFTIDLQNKEVQCFLIWIENKFQYFL